MHRVGKRFGPLTALQGIDLEVEGGEIVAIVGPNGAGKSTLLRILATAVLPDAGRAWVAGHDVADAPEAARQSLGFLLADERSWYWRLTGRHNLEFFAALYGLDRPAARRRTGELLEELGLGEAADRSFGDYSSGMRLRLSLGRALLAEPPVLLLDEPTRSLDPIATKQFRDLARGAVTERGSAVLLATHDLHEAAELADSVVVLEGGRVSRMTANPGSAAQLEQALLATVP
jgi:ABC-2 type transport system ATP-binding protein